VSVIHSKKKGTGLHQNIVFSKKIELLLAVVRGMQYLHSRQPPMLHRDLKPSNVLLDKQQTIAKLCDFGSAKVSQTTTMTGSIGTLTYMSPEILRSDKMYDQSCDVYRYVSLCYALLLLALE
jgi:receptor-interacting serine/threonine-protein kinase 3